MNGFITIEPRTAYTLTLWGEYKGTIKNFVGPCFVNPFYELKEISLNIYSEETMKIKVNDKSGTPIIIAAAFMWHVHDTYLAEFEVDNYKRYVDIQSETALREVARAYPYDTIGDCDDETMTLRGATDTIQRLMVSELNKAISFCGARVVESRITTLQYAPEIMKAMLKKQEATSVVSARHQIVIGALGAVEMAVEKLKARGTVNLSEDKKADIIHDLMMLLVQNNNSGAH